MPDQVDEDDRVLIVGSGPCGAMAALRLVERGIRVVMLDAGIAAPRGMIVRAGGNTVFRWQDARGLDSKRHENLPGAHVEWISSRTLGGLSNYWTAAVPRFSPEDFTEGANLDERYEWPLRYEDLVPYYEMAERELTVTAGSSFTNVPAGIVKHRYEPPPDWLDLSDRVRTAGYQLGPIPMAKGHPWMVGMRGTEFSSYHCIVVRLLDSELFTLIRGAEVDRVCWNRERSVADSVQFVDRRSGQTRILHGRAIVLAAGAVDTTALLLRSVSQDFPSGLGNSNDVVGRYLHDHPKEWWPATPSQPFRALSHPMYLSRDEVDATRPLMAASMTLGLASHRVNTYLRRKPSSFGVQVFGTMVPQPDHGVTLSENGNATGRGARPQIALEYDGAALSNMVRARQRMIDMFNEVGIALDLPVPARTLAPGSSVHFGGTVRMHRSQEFGAVDSSNRLHDAPDVLVVDSSCFTTGPEKNPTLTAMAIASRAADLLADRLQRRG